MNDVTTDLQLKNPRVKVDIDRDKAAALQIQRAGYRDRRSTRASDQAGSRRSTRPMAQYKVLLELLPKYQEHADSLSLLYLKSPQGQLWCRSTRSRR